MVELLSGQLSFRMDSVVGIIFERKAAEGVSFTLKLLISLLAFRDWCFHVLEGIAEDFLTFCFDVWGYKAKSCWDLKFYNLCLCRYDERATKALFLFVLCLWRCNEKAIEGLCVFGLWKELLRICLLLILVVKLRCVELLKKTHKRKKKPKRYIYALMTKGSGPKCKTPFFTFTFL